MLATLNKCLINRKTLKTFADLGISKDLIKGLTENKIIDPTEIQEKAIPFLLKPGTDFIGQAQTGTGKTAAFGLPLLQKIDPKNDKIQALILCPTRELGQQIAKQLFYFTKYSAKIFVEAVYGGEYIDKQIQALKRLSPHPNIITLLEVLYDEPTGRLALVFELMEMNMYESIKGKRTPLPEQRVK